MNHEHHDHLFEPRRERRRRSPLRFLVPVILVGIVLGTVAIVVNGLHAISHAASSSSSSAAPARHRLSRTQRRFRRARYYTVQSGDSLTGIAQKTGVNLVTLEQLNPKTNPNTLQLGQRLRLRR